MSARERFRLAWPTTFGIHVFQMILAGAFAVPIVATTEVPDVLVRPAVAAWIAAMRLSDSIGEETLRNALLPLAAAGLNYPWLSVAWLRALDRPDPFMVHARFALGRYWSAAAIALLTVVCLAALAIAAGASAYGVHRALFDQLDERATDLTALAVVVPFALLALMLITFQDAAYAAVSRGALGLSSVLRRAAAVFDLGLVAQRGAVMTLSFGLALTCWLVPRAALGSGVLADLSVLLVTQIGALGLTSMRAVWLAVVLGRVRS